MSQSGFLGSSNGVVRYLSSNASDVRITITTSQINVTDRGSIRFCIVRIEPPPPGTTVGYYTRTHLTLTNSNVVVDSDASFYSLAVPFAQAVALNDSTFEVTDCLITMAMIVDDSTMTNSNPSMFVLMSVALSTLNFTMTAIAVTVVAVRNTSELSTPTSSSSATSVPTSYASYILGTVGIVNTASSNMITSTVVVERSTVSIEGVGMNVVAPIATHSFLGVGMETIVCSLLTSSASLLINCGVRVVNCNISVSRVAVRQTGDASSVAVLRANLDVTRSGDPFRPISGLAHFS